MASDITHETEAITDAEGVHLVKSQPRSCRRCGDRIRRVRVTKRCPECSITRLASDFSHNPSRGDHLDSRCRPCVNSHKRSVAVDNAMPRNVVEDGAILGHLREHTSAAWARNGDSIPATLRLTDAVVVDYWTGGRVERGEVEVYHRGVIRFPFRLGDRVVLALGLGGLGKVRIVSAGRTAWEDEYPDARLSLIHLFQRWYPEWSPPAELDPWTDEWTKVACPLGPHLDRTAKLWHFEFECSRHTASDDQPWTAIDVLTRRLHFADEAAAVAEISRIEDEQLALLAGEVWAA